MFLCSFRLSKIKLFSAFAVVLVVAVLVVTLVSTSGKGQPSDMMPPADQMTAETNEQRIAFLKYFGWEVTAEPTEQAEITVPLTFDDVYNTYNAIQKQQGLDLENYKGDTVQRYTYQITNYPDVSTSVYAHILVYQSKVIGGDVSTNELDGFMHGFCNPNKDNAKSSLSSESSASDSSQSAAPDNSVSKS